MLEADPTLTPAQIKQFIKTTALTDNQTGVIPTEGSTRWGMGKLNAYHAVTEVLGVTEVREPGSNKLGIWPNPANHSVQVISPFRDDRTALVVTDATGRKMPTPSSSHDGVFILDTSGWASGVYFLCSELNGQRALGKVVKQ